MPRRHLCAPRVDLWVASTAAEHPPSVAQQRAKAAPKTLRDARECHLGALRAKLTITLAAKSNDDARRRSTKTSVEVQRVELGETSHDLISDDRIESHPLTTSAFLCLATHSRGFA